MDYWYIFTVIIPVLIAKRRNLRCLIKICIMALIRFSNLVNDIRGATGGNVFSRNKAGAYVRNRTTPLNPQSSPQMAARALLAGLSQAWRTLSQAQRNAWAAMTESYPYTNKLGEVRHYSGEQLFITLNRNLQAAGEATINDPQFPAGVGAPLTLSVAANAMDGTITATGTLEGAAAEDIVVIQATPPVSAGINSPGRSAFRNITTTTPALLGTGEEISSEYGTIFGAISGAEDSKIFVRIYVVNPNTGEASAPLQVGSVVVSV